MKDKCYIITYQLLNDPSVVISAIKKYGTWAKIIDNTWAIVTEKSAKEVRDELSSLIGQRERLFVIKSGVEAAWKNAACTNEWLKKNI